MKDKRKQPRRRLGESPAIAARALNRRLEAPIVLPPEVARGAATTITKAEFRSVKIDERYQRAAIKDEVNLLIHALQAGGMIAERVHLARRLFAEPGSNPTDLWVVDGQQRWWAHWETETPMPAVVHDVRSLDEEKALFLALNTRVQVSPNAIVHSWPGPGGDLVRQIDRTPGHPLFGRVKFAGSGAARLGRQGVGAAILVKALVAFTSGHTKSENIRRWLARLDVALKSSGMTERSQALTAMIGNVFPGYAPALAMTALALVARERWAGPVMTPSQAVVRSLQRINWASEAPSTASKFLPLLVDVVRRKWR